SGERQPIADQVGLQTGDPRRIAGSTANHCGPDVESCSAGPEIGDGDVVSSNLERRRAGGTGDHRLEPGWRIGNKVGQRIAGRVLRDPLPKANVQVDILIPGKLDSQFICAARYLYRILSRANHRVFARRRENGPSLRNPGDQRDGLFARVANPVAERIKGQQIVGSNRKSSARRDSWVHDSHVLADDVIILPVAGLATVTSGAVRPTGRQGQLEGTEEEDLRASRRLNPRRGRKCAKTRAGAEPEQIKKRSGDPGSRIRFQASYIRDKPQRVPELVHRDSVEVSLTRIDSVVRLEVEPKIRIEADCRRASQ